MIKDAMNGMDVSVLMGANVANEVARDDFCESTVGYADKANGEVFQRLLDCKTFRVGSINDVAGVELCGALKNVVALGAGFCDGLGFGGNTKAAIIRIGLKETIKFAKMFFNGVQDETFLESCGLADLVTTCFGGRNRKCAEAYAKKEGDWDEVRGLDAASAIARGRHAAAVPCCVRPRPAVPRPCHATVAFLPGPLLLLLRDSAAPLLALTARLTALPGRQLEKSMLNGQKLQGTITSKDVMVVLKAKGLVDEVRTLPPSNAIERPQTAREHSPGRCPDPCRLTPMALPLCWSVPALHPHPRDRLRGQGARDDRGAVGRPRNRTGNTPATRY